MTEKEWVSKVAIILFYDFGVERPFWMRYYTIEDKCTLTPKEWCKSFSKEHHLRKLGREYKTKVREYWK